jgi:hypothetical protein
MRATYSPSPTDIKSKMAIKELETEALKRKVQSLLKDVQKLRNDSRAALSIQKQKYLEEFSLLEEDRINVQNAILPNLKEIQELSTCTHTVSLAKIKKINRLVTEIINELD